MTAKKSFQCVLQMCQVLKPFQCKSREGRQYGSLYEKISYCTNINVQSLHHTGQMDKINRPSTEIIYLQPEGLILPHFFYIFPPKRMGNETSLTGVMETFSQMMNFGFNVLQKNCKILLPLD